MGIFRRRGVEDDQREAAMAAKESAEADLAEVEQRWPEVRAEGAWHRWRRDENHFAADLALLMKGGHS